MSAISSNQVVSSLTVKLYLCGWLCLLILVGGCRSKKVAMFDGPVPQHTDQVIYQALVDHNYDFEWYTCETGISLNTPDEGVSGKSYIRMRRDSIIWSSVKKLSVEAVRMLVTENTYAAVNRIEGTYQRGSTESAFAKMGIGFDFIDMQQAIFGNVILPDSASMEISKEGLQYVVRSVDQDLQLKYKVNAYTLLLDEVSIIDYRGREINIIYGDYRPLETGEIVPFLRQYDVPYDTRGNAEIVMKVKEIQINEPKKTVFSIPQRYERVE